MLGCTKDGVCKHSFRNQILGIHNQGKGSTSLINTYQILGIHNQGKGGTSLINTYIIKKGDNVREKTSHPIRYRPPKPHPTHHYAYYYYY